MNLLTRTHIVFCCTSLFKHKYTRNPRIVETIDARVLTFRKLRFLDITEVKQHCVESLFGWVTIFYYMTFFVQRDFEGIENIMKIHSPFINLSAAMYEWMIFCLSK